MCWKRKKIVATSQLKSCDLENDECRKGCNLADSKTKRMLRPFQEDARKEVMRLVKIRVSYERPEELEEVLSRLGRGVKRVRVPRDRKPGRFRMAYIDIENLDCTCTDSMV